MISFARVQILASIFVIALAATSRSFAADDAPDFGRQIAPLFAKYCTSCHNGTDREGKLVLETYAGLLEGGKRGAEIVPGNVVQSRLVRVLSGDGDLAMPPKDNDKPRPEEIALITRWVESGAKGPQGAAIDPTRLVVPKIATTAAVRDPINAVACSSDAKWIAVARYGRVELLSAADRKLVRTLDGLRGNVNDVAFSADGAKLAEAAGEAGLFGEARLWNVADGKLLQKFQGHRDSLYAVAMSADGMTLATGSYDQQIKLWNTATGAEIRTLTGHNGAIHALAFHPNGKLLASASADRTLKLWDTTTGERLETFGQPLLDQYTAVFSPDGSRLTGAGVDNRIRVWQISASGKEGTNPMLFARFAHEKAIIKLAYSPDGERIASSSEDGTLKIWNAATLEEGRSLERQPDAAPAIAFLPGTDSLIVGRIDGTLVVFDVRDGKRLAEQVGVPCPRERQWTLLNSGGNRSRGHERRNDPTHAHARLDVNRIAMPVGATVGMAPSVYADELRALCIAAFCAAAAETKPDAGALAAQWNDYWKSIRAAASQIKRLVHEPREQMEHEPNDRPDQANEIVLPAIVRGALEKPGDADYFSFHVRAGQTLVFDVAARSIASKAAPRLAIYDSSGALLSDRSETDINSDPLLAYTFSTAGRYFLRIDDRMLAGSKEHTYKLTIGEFAYALDCFPPAVPANATMEVELIGPNIPPGTKVKVQAGAQGEMAVPIDAEKFRTRRTINVIVSDLPETVAAEQNDAPERATPMKAPGSACGRLRRGTGEAPSEARGLKPTLQKNGMNSVLPQANFYRFESKAGQQWIIETNAARRGSPIDTRIDVLTADGRPIERVLLQAVRDSYINWRAINSEGDQPRLKNWEEMELNQYVYMNGEVDRLYRAPQGPDSDFFVYRNLGGQRRAYFDSTVTDHPNFEPVYVVEPHPPSTKLPEGGLPVFPIYYSNDDDSERKLGRDSRLLFTAPADGSYLVRVTDVRGEGGDRYTYRLTIREPKPDFNVTLNGAGPAVNVGSGKRFKLTVDRLDYFDGDIRVDIEGVPPGFIVTTPIVIQAGHLEAAGVINALEGAPTPTDKNRAMTKITATARINGRDVTKPVNNLAEIKLAGKPKLLVDLTPADSPSRFKTRPVRKQQWYTLDPTSALSKAGATLTRQSDKSLLAGGTNPDEDSYTVIAPTDVQNIHAIHLEALGDPSLPSGSPGRADGNGNFVLSEFRVTAAPKNNFAKAEPVTIAKAEADYFQPTHEPAKMLDGDPATGWAVATIDPEHGYPVKRTGGDPTHVATFELKQPIGFSEGTLLTFTLDQTSGHVRHNLGRFRLSVLADAPPELVYPKLAEVTIAPGGTAICKLRVERLGAKDRLEFDVDNLPHGVIVDNIGLNGILIPEGQTEQTLYLAAAPWVPETDRLFYAVAKTDGEQASLPVMLHVRRQTRAPKGHAGTVATGASSQR